MLEGTEWVVAEGRFKRRQPPIESINRRPVCDKSYMHFLLLPTSRFFQADRCMLHISPRKASATRRPTSQQSRTNPQIHRAGRQSRGHQASSQSGLGVGCRFPQQLRAVWAGCTCAGARVCISPRSLLRGLPQILSSTRSAASRSASKCNTGSQ